MHPFPFISELNGLDEIKTFSDVMRLNKFVFKIVPWTTDQLEFDSGKIRDVQTSYYYFKQLEAGGWCGVNVQFLCDLLKGYKIPYRVYDYGLWRSQFTHVVAVVCVENMWVVMDPYFGRYYIKSDGSMISFGNLIKAVSENRFNDFQSVYAAKIRKKVHKDLILQAGEKWKQKEVSWTTLEPMGLEDYVRKIWDKLGYMEKMMDKFGNTQLSVLLASPAPGRRLIEAMKGMSYRPDDEP